MFKFILFDIKRNLFSLKTGIVMMFLIVFIGTLVMSQTSTEKTFAQSYINGIQRSLNSYISLYNELPSTEDKIYYRALIELSEEELVNLENKSYQEFFKTRVNRLLTMQKVIINTMNSTDKAKFALEVQTFIDFSEKYEVNLDEITNKIEFRENDLRQQTKSLILYDSLATTTNELLDDNSINSATLFLVISRKMFDSVMWAIILVLIYDNFFKERENGMVKLLLINDKGREKYVLSKCISSCTYVMLTLLIPILFVSLLLGSQDHFTSLDHPIEVYTQGFSSFDSIQDIQIAGTEIDFSKVIKGVHISEMINTSQGVVYRKDLNVISLWKFIALSFIYIGLIVSFIVLLYQFFSIVVKNKFGALGITGVLIIFCMSIDTLFTGTILGKLNPFSKLNYVGLIEGIVPYTYFNGVACLVVYGILLVILNIFLFNKKNII